MTESLWGEAFTIEETPKQAKKILNKIKEPKQIVKSTSNILKSKKVSVEDKLKTVYAEVNKKLGVYQYNTQVITDRSSFHEYISKAIANNIIAIDTETNNSLDPITCKIMGLCLYTSGEKNTYIPINHVDRKTGLRLDNQLTEKDIEEELSRLDKTTIVMHNGKFDYQVIKCTCNISLHIDWDTMIGAKLLDENEMSAGLKQQYIEKIDPTIEKYSIEELFQNLEYAIVDPDIFALYAATDAFMTYKLYEWQKNVFEQEDNSKLYGLAKKIEMPLVQVVADMELNGMDVDQQYADLLSKKYHKRLDILDSDIAVELNKLKPQIDAWRLTEDANKKQLNKAGKEGKTKSEQLEDPIKLSSPIQLAILFYDVLKCPAVSKKTPRGTGEEELLAISKRLKLKFCDLLIQRRELVKLITTYVDVIPELSKRWPDGRVRTHFNQYGAKTGRLSSSDPINFQNIPAAEKTIRLLFKASDGYRIVGADYSAQEPRLTAFYSQDENMINAYKEGKDLYAVIASMSFDRKYEDCLEFYPEGTVIEYEGKKVTCGYKTHQNKEGKKYRTMSKCILLGVLYGRGAASVGEQINKSREEAQEIIDKFFKAFPKVQDWINKSIESAHKLGYVEDILGRRRRLPDVQLPKYDIKDNNDDNSAFNPFLECDNRVIKNNLVDKYEKQLQKIRNRRDFELIQRQALSDNIEIRDNTGFIAQAERQCVNSRVQGGAATLTKNALLSIYNDKRLRDINARLINTVHDEILIEVPEEFSEEGAKLLAENMINSAKNIVSNVPMKCDTYDVNCWYCEEYFVLVESEFKHLLEDGLSVKEAFEKECSERSESTRSQIYEIVKGYLKDYIPADVDPNYTSLTRSS